MYAPSRVSEVTSHSYFLKADTKQLMQADGRGTVVLDNVVAIKFEYYGAASPRSRAQYCESLTTYGPAPPGFDAAAIGAWPAGENCVWAIQKVDGEHVARLRFPIGNGTGALVPLTAANLTDGPWCPDAANAQQYDADLFRIRKIRVTIRLQTGNGALRGFGSLADGPEALFASPGTAASLSVRSRSHDSVRRESAQLESGQVKLMHLRHDHVACSCRDGRRTRPRCFSP